MFKFIKRFFALFRKITVADMARSSLAEHERELIKSQETVAFYQHDVNYRKERIQELKQLLGHDKESPAKPEPVAQRQRSRRVTVEAATERDPRFAAAA